MMHTIHTPLFMVKDDWVLQVCIIDQFDDVSAGWLRVSQVIPKALSSPLMLDRGISVPGKSWAKRISRNTSQDSKPWGEFSEVVLLSQIVLLPKCLLSI